MTNALRCIIAGLALLFAGCAVNAERGKTTQTTGSDKVLRHKVVRTTAYTASESQHRVFGATNAVGTRLKSGEINSAAADWSHFPLGTKFRILDTDKTYVVDDYGPALVGTETIDLYVPSHRVMNQWGARRVTIEVLEEGSYEKSLELLESRQRNWGCRQMAKNIQKQIGTKY
jgi:3D (Asp-Asp-Asp) domain-containing protein